MDNYADRPVEVEAKFAVPTPKIFEELTKRRVTLPGYHFSPPIRKVVRDLYLDTPDFRLLRMGYQLRLRVGESQRIMAVKSRTAAGDGGIYRRLEIEEPLEGERCPDCARDLPAQVGEALAAVLDQQAHLVPVCVIDQTRKVIEVTATAPGHKRSGSQVLALMSLDEMQIRQAVEGPLLARAYEIEVELAKGIDVAELQVIADRLIGAYGLEPSRQSKLERSLAIISRHPADSPENWQGLQPSMPMAEACRTIWYEQFMMLLLNEAGARFSDDPEYVHDARVSIRRARAAARIYQRYFKPKAVRNYLKRLQRTARLFGAVRDLDVAIGKLQEYQATTRKKSAGDLKSTLDEWIAKRAIAHAELLKWLDSKQYAEFVKDFLRFCRKPDAGVVDLWPVPGEEITPFQLRHVAPAMLVANFASVRAYEVWFDMADEVPVETLHRLRIECKYLRYNLEFMLSLLGPEGAEIVALLRNLQDDLGDLNDAVVSSQMLTGEGDTGTASLASYGRTQEKLIARLRKQLREDFARFVAEKNRTRLLTAIAGL